MKFLKLFTTLPMSEIEKLAALQGAEINEAKKALADAATALLHGRGGGEPRRRPRGSTFEEGAIAENLPTVEIPRGELDAGMGVLDGLRQGGPRRLQRRGAAPDQGRRLARQRCRGHRREDDADAGEPHAGRRHQALARQEAPRPAQACIGAFAFDALVRERGNALPDPPWTRPRRRRTRLTAPLKPARVALNVLALCFVLSVLGRGLGESFTVFLKPISESFGWDRAEVVSVYSLSALAGGLAAPLDRAAVRSLRPPRGLCARPRPARRRLPDRGLARRQLWQFQLSARALRRHRRRA